MEHGAALHLRHLAPLHLPRWSNPRPQQKQTAFAVAAAHHQQNVHGFDGVRPKTATMSSGDAIKFDNAGTEHLQRPEDEANHQPEN